MIALLLGLLTANAQSPSFAGGLSMSRSVWFTGVDRGLTVYAPSVSDPTAAVPTHVDHDVAEFATWVAGIDLSVGLFDRLNVGAVIQLDPDSQAIQQALGAIGLDRTRLSVEVARFGGTSTATADTSVGRVDYANEDGTTGNPYSVIDMKYRWINVSETVGGDDGTDYPPARIGLSWITWTQPTLWFAGSTVYLGVTSRVDLVGPTFGLHVLDRLLLEEIKSTWGIKEMGSWRLGLGDFDVMLGFGFRSEQGTIAVRRTGAPAFAMIQKLGPALSAPMGSGRIGFQVGGDGRAMVGPGTQGRASSLVLLGLFGTVSARI